MKRFGTGTPSSSDAPRSLAQQWQHHSHTSQNPNNAPLPSSNTPLPSSDHQRQNHSSHNFTNSTRTSATPNFQKIKELISNDSRDIMRQYQTRGAASASNIRSTSESPYQQNASPDSSSALSSSHPASHESSSTRHFQSYQYDDAVLAGPQQLQEALSVLDGLEIHGRAPSSSRPDSSSSAPNQQLHQSEGVVRDGDTGMEQLVTTASSASTRHPSETLQQQLHPLDETHLQEISNQDDAQNLLAQLYHNYRTISDQINNTHSSTQKIENLKREIHIKSEQRMLSLKGMLQRTAADASSNSMPPSITETQQDECHTLLMEEENYLDRMNQVFDTLSESPSLKKR